MSLPTFLLRLRLRAVSHILGAFICGLHRGDRGETAEEVILQSHPFLDAARDGKNSFWRYLCGLILIAGTSIVASFAMGVVLLIISGGELDLTQLSPSLSLLILVIPFVATLMALWVAVLGLHGRPFRTLITPRPRPVWRRLFLSGAIWLALSGLTDVVLALFITPGNYTAQFDAARFFPYAALALLLIPIQASTEELVMRGYLMQAIGLVTRWLWLPLLVSSLVFASLHSFNPEIEEYGFWTMMLAYLAMGLLLGWVTLRTHGLEAAMGLHIANNLYAALLVNYPGSALPAPSLFIMRRFDPWQGLVALLIIGPLYLLALRVLDRPAAAPSLVVQAREG